MRNRNKSGIRCLFILAVGVVASSVHAADFSVYHMGNSLTGDLLSKFRLVATSHINAQGRQINPDVGMIPVGEVHLVLDERMKAGKFEHFSSVQQLHRDVIHANQIGAYVGAGPLMPSFSGRAPSAYPLAWTRTKTILRSKK